jgi:large subunit ribosomal protein L15
MVKSKTKKYRGSTTHGRGSKKKGRGSGERGGKGNAGMHKHKYIKALKLERKGIHLFGVNGFKSVSRTDKKVLNVGSLELKFSGSEIDLVSEGYDKLLGSGKITRAIKVKVKSASELAKEKIEKAGGELILG